MRWLRKQGLFLVILVSSPFCSSLPASLRKYTYAVLRQQGYALLYCHFPQNTCWSWYKSFTKYIINLLFSMDHLNIYFNMVKQKTSGAGSVVTSTICSSRGQALISNTHVVPHNHLWLGSRGSDGFFWAPGTHMMHIYACRQSTYTHKTRYINLFSILSLFPWIKFANHENDEKL